MLLDGLFVPVTTPFYADGACYWRKLEHNVARYSRTPVAGMLVLGPQTEAAGLTDEERGESLKIVAEVAAPEKVLLANVSAESVHSAVKLSEHAGQSGFDAAFLGGPAEWERLVRDGSLAQLELYFRAVADRSPVPVVLWSNPANGGLELPVQMISQLADHPNVIGLVDAGLTLSRIREIATQTAGVKREVTVTSVFAAVTDRMLQPNAEGAPTFVAADALTTGGASVAIAPPKPAIKTRSKTVGFQVLAAGPASSMVTMLEAGIVGLLPELAASAPQGCHEVLAAFKDGNPDLARLKEARLAGADALIRRFGVAGVKYGCDLNGYFGGPLRLPRVGLTAEERAEVEDALREVKN